MRSQVEARRLWTAIADETDQFAAVLAKLNDENSPMIGPIVDYVDRRTSINSRHIVRLRQIEQLPAFNGRLTRGRRVGSMNDEDVPVDGARDLGSKPDEDDFVQPEEIAAEAEGIVLAEYIVNAT